MGALYSDPPFGRGQTAGVTSTQGGSFVGVVKSFTDVELSTGKVLTNREVVCVAARNNSGAAVTAGQIVKFDPADLTRGVSGTSSSTSDVLVGVADEYLPAGGAAIGDIFWVVVRGPTTVAKTSTAIAAGAAIGTSTTAGSGAAPVGTTIGYALEAAGSALKTRALLTQSHTG